ncbi:hypothetical protein [Exiguobacterium sp. s192]|uniref:hypothetical protein n=1 Tax=Exiguobacterium sp. s192 TaxID=2751206 RepID=UPI001BE5542C|nr:hypothetical protein [Exiguobacterium sp. s192]
MAMHSISTNKSNIHHIIEEELNGSSIENVIQQFGITTDVLSLVKFEDYRKEDGYTIQDTLASCIISPNDDQVDVVSAICFYTEAISDKINVYFSKISDVYMHQKMVHIFIQFIIMHELVHVQQIQNGLTLAEYRSTRYRDNPHEQHANIEAQRILSQECNFQSKVVDLIVTNTSITNPVHYELRELYTIDR